MLGAFFLPDCGPARGDAGRPEATLSASANAQSQFRRLRATWFAGNVRERQGLDSELRRFVGLFPADPQTDRVRVLLAFNALTRGALVEARAQLRLVPQGAGAVHDFARVAEAYALLRTNQPEAAWARLEPLSGKLVDADERLLYSDLRLRAATAAHHYARALRAAEELLAEAPLDSQPVVQQQVRESFQAAPKPELVQCLSRVEQPEPDESAISRAREWLRKMLRERLVQLAVTDKDAALARRLLDTAPSALRASASGAALVGIAGSADSTPLISGRSVGVVLSLATSELRRRSASLAAGIARGLGLPGAADQAGSVQLISADDGGKASGTVEALRELAAQGAAILIAGLDGRAAETAAQFARETAIAVILVEPPVQQSLPPTAFLLGERASAEEAAIDVELQRRGVGRRIIVGRGGTACDAPPAIAGSPRFPVQRWRQERVQALVVFGPAACAVELQSELRTQPFPVQFALGLEASPVLYESSLPSGSFGLGAGRFPTASRVDAAANAALPALDWYEALGHDAARLAQSALQGFPEGRVDDARAVRELHARAERALQTAQAELWTSEERGFSLDHLLPRTLSIASSTTTRKTTP